jgi:gamma-glutamylcyclotransferase (GGCT)/AIG2-like uncharacterized protein YtfP
MEDTSRYLFVYGTLLDELNKFGAYLKSNSTCYGEGKFNGGLYDIGDYPGAIISTETDTWVHGLIFIMNNPLSVLTILDDYEGFGNKYPQPNEFVRQLLPVKTGDDIIDCWVYLYNLSVENLKQIKSGRYFEQ